MVELLKKLTDARGVSGNETEIRNIIKEIASQHADNVTVDRMGNVIAYKRGQASKKKIMLCAHMDEVGFIISGISDNGMLKFKPIGGIDPRVLVSKRVLIGDKNIPGVLGIKAIHLQEPDERNKVVRQNSMYIDIGAKSKEEAERAVKIGDYAVFDSSFVQFGENKVKAKALDDRAGCLVLLEALKVEYENDLYACFTSQEEVGSRGAIVAAYNVQPDIAIVIEGTVCSDIPGIEPHMETTRMGRGPAITFMDLSSYSNKALFNKIIETAERNNIPYQLRENVVSSNDAGAIHTSGGGVATTAISVPCRYIHSPSSVMDLDDFNNTVKLVIEYLKGCE